MPKTEYISNRATYFELVTNPLKKVKNVDVNEEQFLHVNWEDMESIIEPHDCSNVIIAAFVTAQARLKLYSVLLPLDKRVIYFDTDSVFYIPWNPTIINNRSGKWTDDVTSGSNHLVCGYRTKQLWV